MPSINSNKKPDTGSVRTTMLHAGVVFICLWGLHIQAQTIASTPQDTSLHIYSFSEQAPEFPGGQSALMKYVLNKLSYAENLKEHPPKSRVYTSFLIHKDGTVSNARIDKSSGNSSVDSTLLHAIQTMPVWSPARQNGQPVVFLYRLPINCILLK